MTGKEYLQRVRKHIWYVFDRDSIEQELALHLQDSMDFLRDEGYSKEEAERLAVECMGSPDEVGKQLNKEHHPVLGYAWLLSVLALIILAVPVLLGVGTALYEGIKTATPITVRGCETVYEADATVELPTHSLQLDNICVNERGRYYLTYRAKTKYSYSRAGWSTDLFDLKDSTGKHLYGGAFSSHSVFGFHGYLYFDMPEDGLLYVNTKDGNVLEIDVSGGVQNDAE